jgi:hypothetical protein
MKHVALVLLFLFTAFAASAGFDDKEKPLTKTLTGRVVAQTGDIIAGAMLTIEETGEVFFSDFDGNFQLQLPAGKTCTISINTIGFTPLKVNSTAILPFSEQVLQPLP